MLTDTHLRPQLSGLFLRLSPLYRRVVKTLLFCCASVLIVAMAARFAMPAVPCAKLATPVAVDALTHRTQVIDFGQNRDWGLSGRDGRCLVLPAATPVADVAARFARGEGTDLGTGATLGCAKEGSQQSVFVLFAYKTSAEGPIVLSYNSVGIGVFASWVGNTHETDRLTLTGIAGLDVPDRDVARWTPGYIPPSVTPRIMLPDTHGATYPVIVRIDSYGAFYNSLWLDDRANSVYLYAKKRWVAGIAAGGSLVAICLAAWGAWRSKSKDYYYFLLCILVMACWHLVRYDVNAQIDAVAWRRFLVLGPLYLYFLINSLATMSLLRSSGPDVPSEAGKSLAMKLQRSLLWSAIGINAICLTQALLFAGAGYAAPGVKLMEQTGLFAPAITPLLLLASASISVRHAAPGAKALMVAQGVAALGFVSFVVLASFSTLSAAANVVLYQLGTLSLPLEAAVWAFALGTRYKYLEMMAQRKVSAELAQREQDVRSEIATSYAQRDKALTSLAESYSNAANTQSILVGIVDTASHSLANVASRIGIELAKVDGGSLSAEQTARLNKLLASLGAEAKKMSDAAESALSMGSSLSPPEELLRWAVDATQTEFKLRGLRLDTHIAPAAALALVDAQLFVSTVEELLVNCCRYAETAGPVVVSLELKPGAVLLGVENEGALAEGRMDTLLAQPVTPAESTHNGDRSTGRGLYTLNRLLKHCGGKLSVRARAPRRLLIEARFIDHAASSLEDGQPKTQHDAWTV